MILMRETTPRTMAFGIFMYSWQTPSSRNRMEVALVTTEGSMWMSEAFLR